MVGLEYTIAEGTMRPGGVVVARVPGQHPAQVRLTDDQQPAAEFRRRAREGRTQRS